MEGLFISHKEGFSWNLLDRTFAAVWMMMMRRDRDLSQSFAAEQRREEIGALPIHLLVCCCHRFRQCQWR